MEKKQIKDYLPLYMYSQIRYKRKLDKDWCKWTHLTPNILYGLSLGRIGHQEDIQLKLYSISTMPVAEGIEIENMMRNKFAGFKFGDGISDGGSIHFDNVDLAEMSFLINILRSRGYDCDELIPSGLAIDAGRLTPA